MFDKIREFIDGLKNYNTVPTKQTAKVLPPLPGTDKPRAAFEMPTNASSWKGVVLHHSETKDNPNGNDWEAIRHYHKSWRIDGNIVIESVWNTRKANNDGKKFEKPWRDIGYHIGIEREGGKLVVRIGRAWDTAGAHAGLPSTNEYNEDYLGLCIVGNFEKVAPDQELYDLLLAVLRTLMDRFGISSSNVIGHREVYDRAGVPRQKQCPGAAINLDNLRSEL